MRKISLVVLVMVCSISCKRDAPSPSGAVSATASAAASASVNEQEAACQALKEQFRKKLGAAETWCESSADCACSPGGIDPGGCGRVMNRKSANALYDIYTKFHAQCSLDRACAPRRCNAKCDEGRCVRGVDTPPELPEIE